METQCFDEEQSLLKTEISNLLTFYKTMVSTLQAKKNELMSLNAFTVPVK